MLSRRGTQPARAVGPRYTWWVVLMLWAICFFNYADRQAVFSVFPLLEREMHLRGSDAVRTKRGLTPV